MKRENDVLVDIADKIPGGICEILINQNNTLCYANQCFYDMCGYTREQLKQEKNNQYANIICPPDLPEFQEKLIETLRTGASCFEHEHRISCRDGSIQWFLLRGSFENQNQKDYAYCICIDITLRREMEEALRINEERFRIALAQTDSTIFDYDIKTKCMIHGDKSAEQYGINVYTENVPESLVTSGIIHPDTAASFYEMYEKIRCGEPSASCDIQSRLNNSGNYVWRRITMTNVYDGSGHAVRAVGFLEDIHYQKQREEDLIQRSEHDTLTGIYNKGTTEHRITAFLKRESSPFSALFMLDLDNFKGVNDHYGHLFGDYVLKETARRISNLFRENDIVGRVGGDEFVIFMCNYSTLNNLEVRAKELCSSFHEDFSFGEVHVSLSCSVGLSVVPRDGHRFCELYHKADVALYKAKRQGKGRFHVFDPDSDLLSESYSVFY